jgi:O-antigen ligase
VILALIGIVQKPFYAGRIYGVWTPIMKGEAFGPFVNKNHFAGWMLMTVPLALALLAATVAGVRDVKPGWRSRILWLSSAEASQIILIAAASVVMALALVMTMSRSGITALALSVLLAAWFMLRGQRDRPRLAAGAAYLCVLIVIVVAWVGADSIVARFTGTNWTEFNNRRGAWQDAAGIAAAFPISGTGLNTYGVATLFYQRHELTEHYAEAHNDYLQLAAEGGVLLTVPALSCLALFVRDVRRRLKEDRGSTAWWLRAGAVSALVAMALQESVDFSLQMPGNAALFAIVCAIALHVPAHELRDAVRPVRRRPELVPLVGKAWVRRTETSSLID